MVTFSACNKPFKPVGLPSGRVWSHEGLRKANPQSQRKKRKRKENREKGNEKGSDEKKRNHAFIVTKVSCTLLTPHPSLLPKYKPKLYKHHAHVNS